MTSIEYFSISSSLKAEKAVAKAAAKARRVFIPVSIIKISITCSFKVQIINTDNDLILIISKN